MSHKAEIRVLVDVDCHWRDAEPIYRAYVNQELFTERTWIWRDHYLEEALTIVAPPGKYMIHYELVDPDTGNLYLTNWRVDRGPAILVDGWLEILNETT